ncbi:MAG: hypothetical protein ACW99G_16820 [Candidatus Thorarchaeota archaeon]|jgi:hypothetical protein
MVRSEKVGSIVLQLLLFCILVVFYLIHEFLFAWLALVGFIANIVLMMRYFRNKRGRPELVLSAIVFIILFVLVIAFIFFGFWRGFNLFFP